MKKYPYQKLALLLAPFFAVSCTENHYGLNSSTYRSTYTTRTASGGSSGRATGAYAPSSDSHGGYIKPAEGENLNFRGAAE
jgi:hypothetical protein